MSAVLDTHTVLWYLENSLELSSVARTTIEDAVRDARDVYISAISLVETVYLVERRKLPLAALRGERGNKCLTQRAQRILKVHRRSADQDQLDDGPSRRKVAPFA